MTKAFSRQHAVDGNPFIPTQLAARITQKEAVKRVMKRTRD
jgi:hypothetical protein